MCPLKFPTLFVLYNVKLSFFNQRIQYTRFKLEIQIIRSLSFLRRSFFLRGVGGGI